MKVNEPSIFINTLNSSRGIVNMMLIDFGKNIGFNCKQTAEFNLLLFTISITNFNHEEMSRVKFKNKNLRPLKF